MNYEALTRELIEPGNPFIVESHWSRVMEGKVRRNSLVKRPQMQQGIHRTKSNYFSVESFLVLLCLTASLLILPLILPPLPPPPVMFLLLPIGLLVLLLFLALMPYDVRNIASSYL